MKIIISLVTVLYMLVAGLFGTYAKPAADLEKVENPAAVELTDAQKTLLTTVFETETAYLASTQLENGAIPMTGAKDGEVTVNGQLLNEPYVEELALGNCNIELPYQVPESRVFVMGDHRSVSIDSRNTAVGCVSEDQIVGKLVFRIWPLSNFGSL